MAPRSLCRFAVPSRSCCSGADGTGGRQAWEPQRLIIRRSMARFPGEVHGWLESRADEMAGLVERLVAVDTENPPGRGLGECASILRDAMEGLGISAELIELAPTDSLEDDPRIVRGTV